MADLNIELTNGKNAYFASDFHLGLSASSKEKETLREKKIVQWLDYIEQNSQALFLVGDIFDFWFEYKHAIPKGFSRFLGKIASMSDRGIDIYFFTGNHDLWMFEVSANRTWYYHIYQPHRIEYQQHQNVCRTWRWPWPRRQFL
jgi:UDP-2,3-diacylglucosamine pyrophosphatase LpxH